MASFYAELRVSGHTYLVRACAYDFTQATDARGRVVAKVRHGRVQLTLDVPDDDVLLAWAAAPHKPLAGCVVFYQDQARQALETLSWEAGHCVGYQEEFVSGDVLAGAYVCHVTIVAPKLTLRPGGPGTYVPPAPGEHGSPGQAAFLGQPSIGPEVLTPFVPIAVDAIITAAGPVLAPLVAAAAAGAGAIAAVLGLILLTTTPAHAPGRPVPVVSPDELRLRELVAKHAAGTLTPDEVAELIALLAKVKGIHVQKLEDLVVHGPLRGNSVQLPGFHNIQLQYTKRTSAAREALRRKFDSTERKSFIKSLGNDAAKRAALKKSGLTDAEIDEMGKGVRPKGYQIHHKLPLDDGGDNSFDNLLLIKNDPYHLVITNVQNAATSDMNAGDTRVVQWPMCNGFVYP